MSPPTILLKPWSIDYAPFGEGLIMTIVKSLSEKKAPHTVEKVTLFTKTVPKLGPSCGHESTVGSEISWGLNPDLHGSNSETQFILNSN